MALTSTIGAPVMVSSWLSTTARLPVAENTSSAHSSRRKCSSACGTQRQFCASWIASRSSSSTVVFAAGRRAVAVQQGAGEQGTALAGQVLVGLVQGTAAS